MRCAVVAEVVGDGWCTGNDRLAALLLTVEQSKWVAVEANATVIADLVQLVAVVIAKDFELFRSAFAIAD
jgi:site-specific recombinase